MSDKFIGFVVTGLIASVLWFLFLALYVILFEWSYFDQPVFEMPCAAMSLAFSCWFISSRRWAISGRWSCLAAWYLWCAVGFYRPIVELGKFEGNVLELALYWIVGQAIAFFFGDLGDRKRIRNAAVKLVPPQ